MKTMAVPKWWITVLISLALCPWIDSATERTTSAAAVESRAVVLEACERKCAVQKQTEELTLDVGCGSDCRVEQCSHGCKAWQRALDSSCPAACNGTQSFLAPKELYCVMGCNDAVSQYIHKVKERIGTPKAPALVADTLGPTSLSLEWEKVPNLPGAVYLVQWRYESPNSYHTSQGNGRVESEWQYCRNMSWGPETMRKIENLQPYTKYRFRIAVLLGPPSKDLSSGVKSLSNNGMLAEPEVMAVSEPSVVVGTLGEGPPSSPPASVRATAADPTRVSVSWEPGPFPNGPVLSYVVAISETIAKSTNSSLSMHQHGDSWLPREGNFHTTNELPPGFSAVKDIPDSENTNSYMFQNLLPNRSYTVSVRMRNGVGEGPVALTTVSTPAEPTENDNFQPVLILGSHHSVIRQVADMLDEPVLVYNTSHLIKGVGLHIAKDLLFVSDDAGVVWCMPLGGSLPTSGSPIVFTNGNNRRGINGGFGVSPMPSTVITSTQLGCNPLDLSVDWLNDHLYILGEVNLGEESIIGDPQSWQVARCRLDGSGLTIAYAGFPTKPRHFEVDPYNGYLFWVLPGSWARGGGLYRIDLADISNGVRHEVIPMLLMAGSDLGAFTVDHAGFRLLVPDHIQNTVYSVSLDGKEKTNLRGNTQQPMFKHVVSLSWAAGLFYWTDGQDVLTEEYHPGLRAYFHNTYPTLLGNQPFTSVALAFPSAQPLPVPVNPPTQLQAVMGATKAKVSWQVPHLIGVQGKGAWQNWSYELQVKEEINGVVVLHKDIITPALGSASSTSVISLTNSMPTTTVPVHGLKPDTSYVLKARAYTARGRGPWSAEFRGRTLRQSSWRASVSLPERKFEEEKYEENGKKGETQGSVGDGGAPMVLWSADAGLMASDITGDTVSMLIHKDNLKETAPNGGNFYVQDVAWLGSDLLFLVANTTRLYWMNTTSHTWGPVGDIQYAGSVAVDWIGQRLYWSNPKQQLINRGNLNGTQQESLPILTVAKELNIDAVHAFIYWSTGHAVECSRLNGEYRRTYYPAELFSGKQVMGLTLDVDRRDAYWIVRSYEGSVLFKAPMADDTHWPPKGMEIKYERVSNLQQSMVQGPLVYFSNRLLWLQGDRIAVIGDMNGQNAALVSGESLTGLHTAAVIDPALHVVPDLGEKAKVKVIPSPVPIDSIRISGTWDQFRISWSPVTNVNHGKVFYEVKMDEYPGREIVVVDEQNWVEWPHHLPKLRPYSRLAVSVRPFTYWGGSSGVGSGGRARRALLRTPQHLPSTPMSPRAFISFSRDPLRGVSQQEIVATFRWDPPAATNGVILSYGVECWLEDITSEENENQESYLYSDTEEIMRYCDANATDPDYHRIDPQQLEFTAFNLRRNATYFFSVRAYTIIGGGPRTVAIAADTGEECPVPKLLLSTVNNAVQVADFDRHKGISRQTEEELYGTKSKGGLNGPSVDVAFISHEDKIFWLSETQAIMSSKLDGSNRTKIITLNNTGLSLAVDWVGRHLYWSEMDEGYDDDVGKDNNMHENWDWIGRDRRQNRGSSIHCIDLSEADTGFARPFLVLQRSKIIHKIDVSPLTSELIWVEVNKKTFGTLMKSNMNGTNIRPFFMTNRVHSRRQSRDVLQRSESCSCPSDPSVGLAMTVDQCKDPVNNQWTNDSDQAEGRVTVGPDVLWVDAVLGHVFLADSEGCRCQLIVNATSNKGLPPTSVTSDGRNVYWSNSSEGKVYSAPKLVDSHGLREDSQSKQKSTDPVFVKAAAMDVSGVRRIIALGPHLQPYPAPHCLSPWRKKEQGSKYSMTLLERTSHSLSLQLPKPEKAPGCGSVSLASVQYTIHYGKIDIDSISLSGRESEMESNGSSGSQNQECGLSLIGCNNLVTYSRKIEITGLEPFSRYAFFVSMSNYYEQLEGILPIVSSSEYYETSPGAPSPPREVSVAVNGPATAEVRWMAPAKPNGRHLEYEIHWSVQSSSGGVRHKGEQMVHAAIHSGRSNNGSDNFLTTTIHNLLPDQKYLIWVRAYSEDHQEHSESESVSAATFPEPGNLALLSATSNTLIISWKPIQPTADPNSHIPTHLIQYTRMGTEQWMNLDPSIEKTPGDHHKGNLSYSVDNLQPKTRYTFRLLLKYPLSKEPYIWPPDGRFTFETLGDKPGMPGKPSVVQVRRGLYQVSWEVAPDNGAPILYYTLEGRQKRSKDSINPKYANLSSSAMAENDQGEKKAVRTAGLSEWMTLYNGSDNYWIITDLGPGSKFEFRSRASNLYGLGEPSPVSAEFVVPPEDSWGLVSSGIGNTGPMGASAIPAVDSGSHKKGIYFILSSVIPAAVILVVATISIYVYVSRRRDKEQKALHGNGLLSHGGLLPSHIHSHPHNTHLNHSHLHPHNHSPSPQSQGMNGTLPPIPADVELATLRELPRHGNFVHARNALYSPSQLPDIPAILALQDQVPIMPEVAADILADGEIASLPHIRRDQITLTKFLGSGAFGEVFEGVARGLTSANEGVQGETRVAVKTLRKGATAMEKGEFLKEAQLMSNFRHEHILQLLGVCLDNDPNFIIMELMESGDLLSYLRSSRPLIYTPNALTLLDLVAMCVDVARGCRYLEEMHFVHRDLAARNCLVSTHILDQQSHNNSSYRPRLLVKIGDFGLARDIYKSDYYRKEGEGLLPVRWMAPESLVDGVFTCQSDVWSFGVLAWEILTLGQQPYPARNNLEVLHFVRNGGRLSRPANCPDALHSLMNQCWSYAPEARPTFKHCLEALEELQASNILVGTIGAVQNGHYMQQMSHTGVNSPAGQRFKEDELRNQSSGIPKYLELLHEGEEPLGDGRANETADSISTCGYEVPRAARLDPNLVLEENNRLSPTISQEEKQSGTRVSRTFSTASTVSEEGLVMSGDGEVRLADVQYQNMRGVGSREEEESPGENEKRASWSDRETPVSCTQELLPQNETVTEEAEGDSEPNTSVNTEEGDSLTEENFERSYCNVTNRRPLLHSLKSLQDVTL